MCNYSAGASCGVDKPSCPAGQECKAGTCKLEGRPPTSCANDSECTTPETCEDNVCGTSNYTYI